MLSGVETAWTPNRPESEYELWMVDSCSMKITLQTIDYNNTATAERTLYLTD